MPEQCSRPELFDLYKLAIDEYRFEVRLNWDRSMYYITFNTGVVAAGAGLLKFGDNGIVNLFVAGIFLLGCCSSIMGIFAIRKGHLYYRRSVYKKTLNEDVLGLGTPIGQYSSADANLAIGTTAGQARRATILLQADQYLGNGVLPAGSIVFYVASFLGLLALVNASGIVTAVSLYLTHRHPYIPWP
ncbi:membrane hypothetical protein [Candidatus Sulfopaludibacter sp. SbA6]|nr:membrane hypothetical protein [Candidatus Sulfopaludibacter sp. SbA6]